MADVVSVPAGQAAPPPPAGTVWRFLRSWRDGRLELVAVEHPDGQPEPTAPAGHAWRLVRRRGQLVYVAVPQAFAHHPIARLYADEDE